MVDTFRSVGAHSPFLNSHPNLPSNFGHKASLVRFKQVATNSASKKPETTHNMDKGKEENPNEKNRRGYAIRSDEERSGGIYGGNRSIPEDEKDQSRIHENHPEYDKTQGNEVKEKEKARFQTGAHS